MLIIWRLQRSTGLWWWMGFVGAGGCAVTDNPFCLRGRIRSPFKWPYLDMQEVFTALSCCNKPTEKDEIVKWDMESRHYHIDNQYSGSEAAINTQVPLLKFVERKCRGSCFALEVNMKKYKRQEVGDDYENCNKLFFCSERLGLCCSTIYFMESESHFRTKAIHSSFLHLEHNMECTVSNSIKDYKPGLLGIVVFFFFLTECFKFC